MIVRRFMNWLRSTVATARGGVRQRQLERTAREPVLVGVSPQLGITEHAAPTLMLSNWLENARRLRPRLVLPQSMRDPEKINTRPLRHKIQPTIAQPPAEMPFPRISLAPIAAEPANTASHDSVPIAPITRTSDDKSDNLDDLEQLDAETRRLLLLRHLVRRRIFNEGFVGDNIPRQYHRSLGLDTTSPQE